MRMVVQDSDSRRRGHAPRDGSNFGGTVPTSGLQTSGDENDHPCKVRRDHPQFRFQLRPARDAIRAIRSYFSVSVCQKETRV